MIAGGHGHAPTHWRGVECPWPLRDGWAWRALSDVAGVGRYGLACGSRPAVADEPRLLTVSDLAPPQRAGAAAARWALDWEAVGAPARKVADPGPVLLRDGDVVVCRSGHAGTSRLVVDPPAGAMHASYLVRFRPRTDVVDPTYLAWWLHTLGHAMVVGLPRVNARELGDLPVPVPVVSTQKRAVLGIAECVDAVDARLAELADARAAAVGRRDDAIAQVLAGAGPADRALGEAAVLRSGDTPPRRRPGMVGGAHPWVTISDLNDAVVHDTRERLTDAGVRATSAREVPRDSICVAMVGRTIGKMGRLALAARVNQAVAAVTVDPVVADPGFVWWWLRGQRSALRAAGRGSGQANINLTMLRAWPLPLPDLAVQRDVADRCARVDAATTSALAALDAAQQELGAWQEAELAWMFGSVRAEHVPGDEVDPGRVDAGPHVSGTGVGGSA